MLIVHILGAVVVAVGLILFALDQRTPVGGVQETAAMKAWKIELGGPSSLILIVVGLAAFMFPFTPWATPSDPPVAIAITTTTAPTTTTTTFPVTPIDPITIIPFDPSLLADLPQAPLDWYWIDWEEEWCGSEAIAWTSADDLAVWWIVPVDAYDFDGNLLASWEIESTVPLLCRWEFETEGAAYYWMWPRGVNFDGVEGDWFWFEVWL